VVRGTEKMKCLVQEHDEPRPDHVYYWHPQSSVDQYWWSTPRLTHDRHSIDISVNPPSTSQSTDLQFSLTLYGVAIDTSNDHTLDVGRRVDRSSVNDVSVVCRWCILRSIPPPWGVLPYMAYIGMCGPKGYGFSALLVINWVSILAILPPFWS